MKLYGVYNKDVLEFKGDVRHIARQYRVCRNTVYCYIDRDRTFLKKYRIRSIDETPLKPQYKSAPFEDNIQYIIKHLRLYGNTTLPKIKNSELKAYVDAIEENGFNIKVVAYNDRTGNQIRLEGSKPPRGKRDINYIVEVL